MKGSLDIRNFTKSPTPRFPYEKALEEILPGWDMSLVFAGTTRAQKMNIALRKKDYIPNVLSYVAGEKSGEIIICPEIAKKQAPEYEMSYTAFVGFLFIHGCLHLKGMQHGDTMDRKELALLKRFFPNITSTSVPTPHVSTNRNRH